MQTDNAKKTMSPILQYDISNKMTITSIKHENHNKRCSTPLDINEINSSRKIAKIINETEDNIQQMFKFNHSDHKSIHTSSDYISSFHNRYDRCHRNKRDRHSYHSTHTDSTIHPITLIRIYIHIHLIIHHIKQYKRINIKTYNKSNELIYFIINIFHHYIFHIYYYIHHDDVCVQVFV